MDDGIEVVCWDPGTATCVTTTDAIDTAYLSDSKLQESLRAIVVFDRTNVQAAAPPSYWKYTVWYNALSWHALPTYVATVNHAIIQSSRPTGTVAGKLHTAVQPFPDTSAANPLAGANFGIGILIAMAVILPPITIAVRGPPSSVLVSCFLLLSN